MTECRKFRYPDQLSALRGARTVCNKTGTRFGALHFYRCESCRDDKGKRAWHFGHRPGTGAWTRRAR